MFIANIEYDDGQIKLHCFKKVILNTVKMFYKLWGLVDLDYNQKI